MSSIIIDYSRTLKHFKSISFSGYKKQSVCKELIKAVMNKKIEDVLNWTSELICSGHYLDLWECVFSIMSQYIHIGNPKLSMYIFKRYLSFKDIILSGYQGNELLLRNNESIRILFSEIMFILCYSRKEYALQSIKLSLEELELTSITHCFSSDNVHYLSSVYTNLDPKELFIPLNELAYNVSKKVQSTHNSSYWLEWILAYEKKCKKNKRKLVCKTRSHVPVHDSFKSDVIWVIWDIIHDASKKLSTTYQKTIDSLYHLYCVRFSLSSKHKRKLILYHAFLVLCEKVDYTLPIIQSNVSFSEIKKGIPKIFQTIKKHEIHESGLNIQSTNINNTSKKIQLLNSLS